VTFDACVELFVAGVTQFRFHRLGDVRELFIAQIKIVYQLSWNVSKRRDDSDIVCIVFDMHNFVDAKLEEYCAESDITNVISFVTANCGYSIGHFPVKSCRRFSRLDTFEIKGKPLPSSFYYEHQKLGKVVKVSLIRCRVLNVGIFC
jgi:hypothetical protein